MYSGPAIARASVTSVVLLFVLVGTTVAHAQDSQTAEQEEIRLLRRRAEIRPIHRLMGITTWSLVGGAAIVGSLRYANVIGFGERLCDPGGGDPIFGTQFGCGVGLKIWHLTGATLAVLSYATTRILAALMPDPDDAAAGPGKHAARLRIHRALSWVHLTGMVAMPLLGLLTSASNDRDDRAALATAHLVVGYTTFATITVAGSLMLF
jgi:hypothetical protein